MSGMPRLVRLCQSAARWSSTATGAPAAASAASSAPAHTPAAAPAAAAPVAAVAPARAPVPTHLYAAQMGKDVSTSWARFNVEDTRAVDVAEAKRMAVLSAVSDVPAVKARRAIIFPVGASAMTSGVAASNHVGIRFTHVDKWGNPLMGWVSSADTQAPVAMHTRFESVEAAILACERNGWSYEVAVPYERKLGAVDNQYAYNFLPRDVQHKMKTLGPRKSRAIFKNEKAGEAQWVNFRHTTYGPDAWRPADYQTETAWTGEEWPKAEAAAHKPGAH